MESVVSTLASVLLGGLITWFAAWRYYKKAGDELKAETALLRKANMAVVYMLEHPDADIEAQRDDAGNPVGLIVSAAGHAEGKATVRGVAADAKSCHGKSAYNSGMSSQFDELEKRARALSREEKAALARVLIDELDPVNEPGVEELWLEEARRRYDAYRRGEMQAVSGDEAMARARSQLR